MRISTLFRKTDAVTDPSCHGTLVLHADGSVECDQAATCGGDELLHDLWVTCDELRCGCVGDETPHPAWLLAA